LETVVSLDDGDQTLQKEWFDDALEIDLVTHDAAKFFRWMLTRNGYVLEQLFSPLVVHTTPEHQELKEIASGCITRHHAHHYLGFAATQWRLFEKETPPRVKPLLYTYRVLMTGIHLMRTGQIEANIGVLNDSAALTYVDDLIERKRSGAEKGVLDGADVGFYRREYERLTELLQRSYVESELPEVPASRGALNDLLVRLRLHGVSDDR
jgi:predicted nucleotidyltransferase